MSHELVRLRAKLCNTPHLVTEDTFNTILEYLDARNNHEIEIREDRGDIPDSNRRYNYNREIQVATMNIDGPTSYRPVTVFGMACGGFSYEVWKEDFLYLAESGVKTVAFLVSSGGGEAYGCFDSARYVRKIADEYGIYLITYVDGIAASAAYAISSIADEIIMGNGSEIGSIGVLISLMNDSKHLEKEGYERTFITYGDEKIPFAKDGSWRKEFIDDLQYKVDLLGQEFIGFVAENRNLSVEAVKSTQAKTFVPKDAIEIGLADKVMTPEAFYEYLADTAQENNKGTHSTMKNKLFGNKEEMSVTDTAAELSALQEQNTELTTQLAETITQLTEAQESLAKAQASLEAKEAQLSEALESIAQMEKDKEDAKASLRKQKLSAVMAEDKVEGIAASLAALDDDAFETVLSGFAAQQEIVEKSSLMDEVGSSFEAQEEQHEELEMSTTDKAILQRLGK